MLDDLAVLDAEKIEPAGVVRSVVGIPFRTDECELDHVAFGHDRDQGQTDRRLDLALRPGRTDEGCERVAAADDVGIMLDIVRPDEVADAVRAARNLGAGR